MERIVRVLIFGLAIIDAIALLGRGSDYLTGDPSQQIKDFDTSGASLLWALMCIIPAICITIALTKRDLRLLMRAGIGTAVIYGTFGIISLDIVFQHPIDDWRLAFDYFGACARWALIAAALSIYRSVLDDRVKRGGGGADGAVASRQA